MAELLVEGAEDALPFGHQDHGAASGLERGGHVPQGGEIVRDVLQDVQTDHRVHLFVERGIIFRARRVQERGLQVRP